MENLEYYTKKPMVCFGTHNVRLIYLKEKLKLLMFLLNLERAGHIFALTDMQDGLATRKSVIISYGKLQNLLRLIFAISKWHKQCENMEFQHQKLKRKLELRFLKNLNFLIWTNDYKS